MSDDDSTPNTPDDAQRSPLVIEFSVDSDAVAELATALVALVARSPRTSRSDKLSAMEIACTTLIVSYGAVVDEFIDRLRKSVADTEAAMSEPATLENAPS